MPSMQTIDRAAVAHLILETLQDFDLPEESSVPAGFSEHTILFGRDGLLDSIGLVSFILDVEENLRARFGISITLADERAMSQNRSPFRSVSSLVDYAVQVAAERRGR